MMSHCTASLKLTPWHEGTFASAVIYSPQPVPFPSLLLSLTLFLFPPSRSCLKMTFIILSLNRSRSFPAARELREKKKQRKWGTNRPARPGFTVAIGVLLSVTWGPCWNWQCVALWKQQCCKLSGEIQLHVWGATYWVRTAGKGLSVRVSVRISTSSNHRRPESHCCSLADIWGFRRNRKLNCVAFLWIQRLHLDIHINCTMLCLLLGVK